MLTLLKIGAAVGIAFGVLNPGFGPRAEDCQCKAKANAFGRGAVPHADDCECKGKANATTGSFLPHADSCQCKADA